MDEVLELLRVKLPKYLASIIFGLSAVLTDAQTVHFKNYSTKDGLITDEVFNLYQDNQGYIWVFSEYGTVKYTGAGFKPVLKNLPTKEAFIFSIFENGQGKKWVANSNARIYEVRNDSALIIPGIEKISTLLRQEVSEISQLYVDDSSNIYAITKADSYKFIKKRGLYEPVNLGDQVKTDSVHTLLHEIPGGKYMAVKNSGIENYTFKKGKKRVYLQIDGLPKQYRLPTPPYYFPMGRFKKVRNAVYFVRGDYLCKIIEGEEIS